MVVQSNPGDPAWPLLVMSGPYSSEWSLVANTGPVIFDNIATVLSISETLLFLHCQYLFSDTLLHVRFWS